ncbi:MAG TPA: hypothetical protein VIX63_14220 [Vicinamibacterales bacterium]
MATATCVKCLRSTPTHRLYAVGDRYVCDRRECLEAALRQLGVPTSHLDAVIAQFAKAVR